MAISFIGAGTGAGGSGSAPAAAVKHASTASGDFLLGLFVDRNAATLTVPGGTTRVTGFPFANGATLQIDMAWKIDDGTAFGAWTRSANLAYITNIVTFRGVHATTPFDVIGTPSANATATSIAIANGITTNVANTVVIGYGCRQDDWLGSGVGYVATTNTNLLTAEDGVTFIEAFEAATTSGSDLGICCDYGAKATAAAQTSNTFTFGTAPTSALSIGGFLAIQEAAAAAEVIPDLTRSRRIGRR